MAIASITVTCSTCGNSFTHRKECRNRREADSYEVWAINNISECPSCARARRNADASLKLANTLAALGRTLPVIKGCSDKQIAYAESVREQYLAARLNDVTCYHKGMQRLQNPDAMAATISACEESGLPLEEGIAHDLKKIGLYGVHIALTSASARDILDNLAR